MDKLWEKTYGKCIKGKDTIAAVKLAGQIALGKLTDQTKDKRVQLEL